MVGSSHRLSEVERTTPAAPSKEWDHLLDGAATPPLPRSQGGDFAFPAGCPRRPCPADDLWVTLKHARRGGRAIQKISRSIRLSRGRGGCPINPKGKPPRLRLLRWLRQIFFDDAATPPCGGARRGITPDSNFFTASPSAPVKVASQSFF